MEQVILGRGPEKETLRRLFESNQSEFLAVCGRRRVGKTFLVREYFDGRIAFQVSGLANSNTRQQLKNFSTTLSSYTNTKMPVFEDWLDAFACLIEYINSLPEGKKVIFLDELPWMDTSRSNFIAGLEHFWNGFASARHDILLIVCGSATSWMMDKLINNHGGLYGRITDRIILEPFTLKESEEYLDFLGFNFSRYEVAVCYMILGGIPYYMKFMDTRLSLSQNIDNLLFAPNGKLYSEFDNLYVALFKNSDDYIKVVKALSIKAMGLTRNEIIEETGIASGSALNTIMQNLETCGFIRRYANMGKMKRDMVYQLVDFFTLFHFYFRQDAYPNGLNYFSAILSTPTFNTWAGLTFEILALCHTRQIKEALGIRGVATQEYAWRGSSNERNVQIDLVINRGDNTVNVCEMKFSKGYFVIDKDYSQKLQEKLLALQTKVPAYKSLQLTMITTNGIMQNKHSSVVNNEIKLDDLFAF